MSDTISRQAALDALRYAQHRFTVADEAGGMGTVKWSEDVIYFAAAERVLSELPSAQATHEERTETHALPDPYKTDIRINVSKWEDKEPTEIVKEEQNMANNIIGERIAGLLREQGKTQRELAEQVGTTEVSMSRYIKGDRVPKGPILANIAKALHTTTDYLVGNEKDSNDPELEYNYTQRAIARNANRWSKKQKLNLVNALFENDD